MSLFKSVKYLDGDEEDAVEITRPGKVLVEFDNGDTFEGSYVTSSDTSGLIRAGHGIYVWKTGGKYDGEYKNGRRNGKGIYVFGSGEKYTGEWLNNVKSGKGKYSYTNGDHFTGTWVGDKRNGKGVFYNAKQDNEIEGEWKDGKLLKDSIKQKPKEEAPAVIPEVKKEVPAPIPAPEPAKTEEVAKETVKESEPNVEEAKKTENAEEPKKDEPEKDEPKKEEPKEEVTKEEAKPDAKEGDEEKPESTKEEPVVEELKKETETPSEDKDVKILNEAEAGANTTDKDAPVVIPPAPVPVLEPEAAATSTKLDLPLVIMIFGAPACGKGTQCEFITKKFGLVHVSTGDLLRAERKAGTPIGLKAQEAMDAGELVSSEIINELVKQRLHKDDIKKNGVLLDGYPRAVEQAEFLKEIGVEVDLVLKLDVPEDVLYKRATGRRQDPITKEIYHIDFNPPPEGLAVDHRPDDKEEKVKERLKIYAANLSAIEGFYSDKIKTIDGNRDRETVTEDVLGIVEEVHGSKSS